MAFMANMAIMAIRADRDAEAHRVHHESCCLLVYYDPPTGEGSRDTSTSEKLFLFLAFPLYLPREGF